MCWRWRGRKEAALSHFGGPHRSSSMAESSPFGTQAKITSGTEAGNSRVEEAVEARWGCAVAHRSPAYLWVSRRPSY